MNVLTKLCLLLFTCVAAATSASAQVEPQQRPLDLSKLTSPILFKGDAQTAYRDPLLHYADGVFRLFFTLNTHDAGGLPYWQTAYSKSTDLVHWSAPVPITPADRKLNYSSPGSIVRQGGDWVLCLQTYPTPLNSIYGDDTSRLWTMRSKDLEHWGEPELIKFLGPDVARDAMPRMIDPYLMRDKDEPDKWWCFCKIKQTGVNLAWSRDLKTWHPTGKAGGGENPCVIVRNDEYVLFHSPSNGIGIKYSRDLKEWRDGPLLTLGQANWPWAKGRLTAGFVLDGRSIPGVGRYLMVFHGSGPEDEHTMFHTYASIGLAWSDDLTTWHWAGEDKDRGAIAAGRTASGKAPGEARGSAAINATDEGVVADGRTKNTGAINRLIEKISAAGGGTLWFPAGDYLTGSIFLRSNVTLHLDSGATLHGSTDIADYPETASPRPGDRLEYGRFALIHAEGQHDIAIEGNGTIQGHGDDPNFTKKDLEAKGWSARDAYLKRPYGLSFIQCTRVRVRDIKLENIAFWCQGYLDCDDVSVSGMSVISKKHDYNNDGIDIDGCRNVRVSDCYFFVGDDAICLKASYRDCENVVVTNCTASSLANGVKLGTASNAGFRNIAISNIVLDGIQAAGIALEIVDGGTLDGVTLDNFSMRHVGTAFFIRLGHVGRRWTMDTQEPKVGALRNVSISNIVAQESSLDRRPLGSSITGLPGHAVENISISNVLVTAQGAGDQATQDALTEESLRGRTEAEKSYPEYTMFGALPAYGLYVRHARGINLNHVRFTLSGADSRPVFVFDDLDHLSIDDLDAPAPSRGGPLLVLSDVRGARITGTKIWETLPVLLQTLGKSSQIVLGKPGLQNVGQAVVSDAASKGAVRLE